MRVPSRGRSLGWAVSTGSDLGRRCARCCSVCCLSRCSPGTHFLALQCRQCPKVTGHPDSGETARLRAPGSPRWPQEVGTRVVQASGGAGEGGRSRPSASVLPLERNPISSHRSLLSRPGSTRWCSGALSYKNNLSWAHGGGGGWGALSPGGTGQRTATGETVRPSGHREYQRRSLRTEGHGARDRTGSQGPTATPS